MLILFSLVALAVGCAHHQMAPSQLEEFNARESKVIFLGGTLSPRFSYKWVRDGLRDAGLTCDIEEFHWNRGLSWLHATNQRDAELIRMRALELVDLIVAAKKEQPDLDVHLVAQSAGCNVVRWALELLPPGVQVTTVVLLAPSIWSEVDMGPALKAVAHRLYHTRSALDFFILGIGTRVVGTPDRDHGASAGHVGFSREYPKLVEIPCGLGYPSKGGHLGDHTGGLSRRFSREVTARCLVEKDFDPANP